MINRAVPDRAEALQVSYAQLFENARTHRHWLERAVPDSLLKEVFERAAFGPTSLNSQPMRVVFVRSPEGKRLLRDALDPANVERTMQAPVTAVIGYDMDFPKHLTVLLPGRNAAAHFDGKNDYLRETAFRSGTLQAAYMMLAARSFGLDIGAMSGFDADAVDRMFFGGTAVRSNLLCNLGYGDGSRLPARNPRMPFDNACRFA